MYYPSVFWINASDLALQCVVAVGFISAWATILGAVDTRLSMAVSWICLLSLDMPAGLGYPWDCYLIETTFLCLFFPPLHTLPLVNAVSSAVGLGGAAASAGTWTSILQASMPPSALAMTAVPPVLAAFLWRWLAFRLMIGFGKLKFTGTTDKDDLCVELTCPCLLTLRSSHWHSTNLSLQVHQVILGEHAHDNVCWMGGLSTS